MNRLHKIIVRRPHTNRGFVSNSTCIILNKTVPLAAYKPSFVEKNKYNNWEKSGQFKPDICSYKPNFCMVLPPPNVTGKLHLGHALACTIQDVIVRRKKALGYNVLWLPGFDHAGIATQSVVEKHLSTKGKTRQDLGRDEFIKEVYKWKDANGSTISNQLRTLGCSLDWSRQVFTMDDKHTHAVNTAFIHLFQKGLIYRKKSLVNWCNALKSTVSDIEVDNIPINGPTDIKLPGYELPVKFGLLYDIVYKVVGSDEEIVVSTTMPETMLGDTAVAVHPNDSRYSHLAGQRVMHPFRNNTTIPIIFDEFVDMNLGTGAVKITPAHSKIDYNIAKEHNLKMHQVINENGVMENTEGFNNLKRYTCRQLLVEKLKNMNLLRDIRPHQMILPVCSRTGDVIDYLPKEQWFLSCKELNKRAAEFIKNGELKVAPEKFVRYWLGWMDDDRDWCISRQLWWGHQIPAYKCSVDKNVVWIAAPNEATAKSKASRYLRALPEHINTERDPDVLDTWFSSGIYPFAALGWPNLYQNPESGQFYPLSLMATGHDILGFWVHRMVILGLELTGQLPFNNVLLHGIICDNKGAKMSKSKGNVIDPMDIINGASIDSLKKKSKAMYDDGILNKDEFNRALAFHKANFSNTDGIPECGVDALRFTLLSHDIKSHFVNFDAAICHANKLFCNKILQSVKYTHLSFTKLQDINESITADDLTYFDKWILSKLAHMVGNVNSYMDSYDFHLATKALRTFMYNEFCDIYLEATKPGFDSTDPKIGYAHAHTLSAVLNTALRCLSPFMVYLADELLSKVPEFKYNIICNFDDKYTHYIFPQNDDFKIWEDHYLEDQVDNFLKSIYLVRELKGLYSMSNKLRPAVCIKTDDRLLEKDINDNKIVFLNLTKCADVHFDHHPSKKYVKSMQDKDTCVYVEVLGDNASESVLAAQEKLKNKVKKLRETIIKLESKNNNRQFTSTAEWVRNFDKEKLLTKKKELEELQRMLE